MPNPLYHRDIISINDLDRSDLELVLNVAASLKKQPQPEFLKHKVIASCFLRPLHAHACHLKQLFIV